MFDTYELRPFIEKKVNIRVTEKRAPTDESVRLLKDFEKEARDKIINSIALESNLFHAKLFLELDHLSQKRLYYFIYELNGKRIEVKHSEWMDEEDKEKIINGLLETLSKSISRSILKNLITYEMIKSL